MIPSRVWMKALNRGVCVFKGCWFKTWFVWRLTWKNFKGCSLIKNIPDFAFLTEPFDLSRHLMLEGEELTDCFSLHQRDSDPSPMQQPSLIVDRCSLHQPKISSKRSGGLVCCRHRVHHGRGWGAGFPAVHRTWLTLSKIPRIEHMLKALCAAAITTSGIPTKGEIKWSYPLTGQQGAIRGTPLPPAASHDGWPAVTASDRPLSMQAVCIQSTLCFYRPVEPKIARLLNPRLTSVWLQPHFLKPKSFLTTTQ